TPTHQLYPDHEQDAHQIYHDHEEHEHHHDHDHEEHEHHHDHDHEEREHHHHHHHDADEVFASWGMETPVKYSMEEIRGMLARLEEEETFGTVLRAKGMVPDLDGGWIEFDYVPGEAEVRTGSPDVTGKFCVIGAQLNEEHLEKLFRRKL
ncbi:MAG: GTP-binding protein, partial [Lachnospiraceae bacterium]|nr:GTP-binding protein [Lachnospiraceae bacterium]